MRRSGTFSENIRKSKCLRANVVSETFNSLFARFSWLPIQKERIRPAKISDMNAYTLSLYGFSDESEFDNALPEDICWPVRRKTRCSHTRQNKNGKEFISLCRSAELIIVNGSFHGNINFDSNCTRDATPKMKGVLSIMLRVRLKFSRLFWASRYLKNLRIAITMYYVLGGLFANA